MAAIVQNNNNHSHVTVKNELKSRTYLSSRSSFLLREVSFVYSKTLYDVEILLALDLDQSDLRFFVTLQPRFGLNTWVY